MAATMAMDVDNTTELKTRLSLFQKHRGTGFAGPQVLPPARGLA
jgi:hypothetical protein